MVRYEPSRREVAHRWLSDSTPALGKRLHGEQTLRPREIGCDPGVSAIDRTPPLEIVVVTYNSEDYIHRCLDSVFRNMPRDTLVHVVDNASSDATVNCIRDEYPSVDLHVRPDNPGFAVANNQALRGVRAPIVLILNPDTEVHPGTITTLLAFLNDETSVGVVGCKLVTLSGDIDHAAKRFIPTPRDALLYFLGELAGRKLGRYVAVQVDPDSTADVDAVNGAFMMVRTAAMRDVGLFDESYWMYAEDLDWCTRFRAAGYRVVYRGDVSAMHIKGGSSGIRSIKLNYHFHRSMALYYWRHQRTTVLLDGLVLAGVACRFVATQIANEARRAKARSRRIIRSRGTGFPQ